MLLGRLSFYGEEGLGAGGELGNELLGVGVGVPVGVGEAGLSTIAISTKSPNTPLTWTLIVSVPSTIPSSIGEKILAATLLLTVKLPDIA